MHNDQEYEKYIQRKQTEFYEKYPLCFPDGEPVCGFYCDYGWWPLLDKLCAAITVELEKLPTDCTPNVLDPEEIQARAHQLWIDRGCPSGESDHDWFVAEHQLRAEAAKACAFRVAQVKEKFGGLRFYVDNSNEAIDALVDEAESESYSICEQCGSPGERRDGGWTKVRCDACQAQWEKVNPRITHPEKTTKKSKKAKFNA
jgi:hypothetical protein